MMHAQQQQISKRGSVGLLGPALPRGYRDIGIVSGDLVGLSQPVPKKVLSNCRFELPLDSVESKTNERSDGTHESTDCDSSDGTSQRPSLQKLVRWSVKQDMPLYLNCSEFDMGNNYFDMNNSGQGVDMQNLPSIAEQMERQRTWMTLCFRYRMNWYEAKPALANMPRENAYMSSNLPLWTRCVKIQLHRKSYFLNGVRAFQNRMQCATSGVRFTMNAFYRETGKETNTDGPVAVSLPFFKSPDDMPDLKTMVVARMNVFVSNGTCFFDQFWDECLKEEGKD